MTDQKQDDVGWAEVERRGRRWNWLALPLLPAFLGAIVGLTGGFGFWEGRSAWVALGLYALAFVVLQVVAVALPRLRTRQGQGYRIQYALRQHVDPGPDLRETTDVYARRMAGNGWMAWLFPFVPVSWLLAGQWDRPWVAVPSALVLVGCALAMTLWFRRQASAARRWVEDPAGPDRVGPEPKNWERWLFGRRLLWLMLGLFLITTVLAAVVSVLA